MGLIKCTVLGLLLAGCANLLAAPANDNFESSAALTTSTNIAYSGDFTGSTMQAGEPHPYGSNTVWVSWAAPVTGVVEANFSQSLEDWAAFIGLSLDHLQSVPLSFPRSGGGLFRFVCTQGTLYQFQLSSDYTFTYTFNLHCSALGQCINDNFTNAIVVKGTGIQDPQSTVGATMELGEPAHMGNTPQQSLWWTWQAPNWGNCSISARSSTATNYVIGLYTGGTVDTLSLVKLVTNQSLVTPVVPGETYHIAVAVPTNTVGDIALSVGYAPVDTSAHNIAGNLLQEPSWEGTALRPQHWTVQGSLGGYVNEPNAGPVDGTTWPALGTGTTISQSFPTIPGHEYSIRFGYRVGGDLSTGTGDPQVAVSWDNQQIGVSTFSGTESGWWHWGSYKQIATNPTSQITFHNLGRNLEMDAFSVVDASAPPAIVTPPHFISTLVGGTAAFLVGATGTAPLTYQWFFNGAALDGQTSNLLLIPSASTNDVGNYFVVVTNNFGSVTSSVVGLNVDAPIDATILSQPYSDVVPVGGYFAFTVAAAGTPPLGYQWFLNGVSIVNATNNSFALNSVQLTNAGVYTVRVSNSSSTVLSLPATLTVDTNVTGGGLIAMQNRLAPTNANAPAFDVDGITPLTGSNYLAQLYAGPSLSLLRPVGQPIPFLQGFNSGYFGPKTITLPNVRSGSNVVAQVRAWDVAHGSTFEQARASGGRFGKSVMLNLIAGGGTKPPAFLLGLQSFNLQAGLPYLQVATVTFVGRQPGNTIIWAVNGQTNSVYSVEKSENENKLDWRPYTVVTNSTGTATFSDTANSASKVVLYRARLLD